MLKIPKPSIHHYKDSWWKVEDTPIWLLAGKDTESTSDLKIGWYFADETGGFNGPFNTRAEAEAGLETYANNTNT